MKKFLGRLNDPKVLMVLAFIFGMTLVSLSEVANPGYGPVPGVGMIILGAMLFISTFAWVYAKHDATLIAKGEKINHIKRFFIRAGVATGFSFAALGCFCWDIVWLTIFQGAIFWLLFEIFLNLKRDRDWWYISVGPSAPLPERWFKGNWQIQMMVKILILIWSFVLLAS